MVVGEQEVRYGRPLSKSIADAWVDWSNREHPEVIHWVEECPDELRRVEHGSGNGKALL